MIERFKADGFGLIELDNYYKVWSSAFDGRCCSLCSKLEGTAIRLDEPFEIAGRVIQEPPLHDRCRCAVVFVEEQFLDPRLVRVHNTFLNFSSVASNSKIFVHFINSFFAAEYFLGQLAAAPSSDLALVGLGSADFKSQFRDLQRRRDQIFNVAIKRAYDYEWENAQSLKTEHGRRARMERWLQLIIDSQALSPVNYNYLKELFNQP